MDLLVIGAGGLLGSNVVAEGVRRDHSVTGTYHSSVPSLDVTLERLDIRDEETFHTLLDTYRPDAVVNCAARTDVDACEEDEEAAFEVNGKAPGRLATACRDSGCRFVHISTDYVFDGDADTPYSETAATEPVQIYGASKLEGERMVWEADAGALITRLSFIWGWHQATDVLTGFPAWVRNRLVSSDSTALFTDQSVTPSRAGQAAATILDLVASDHAGTFHVTSRSCVTPYQFGIELCEYFDASPELLEKGSMSAVNRSAVRPSYTCLDVSKVEKALGRKQPTLEADLAAVADLL